MFAYELTHAVLFPTKFYMDYIHCQLQQRRDKVEYECAAANLSLSNGIERLIAFVTFINIPVQKRDGKQSL